MKKLLIIVCVILGFQADGQNIRKGIEIASPAENGTAGANLNAAATDNILIGHDAGLNITSGSENLVLGKFSGYQLGTGNANSFIGVNCGSAFNAASSGNTCLGSRSGFTSFNASGNYNTFLGNESGYTPYFSTSNFNYNTFVGAKSGFSFNGGMNTILGANTGVVPGSGYFGTKMTLLGVNAHNGSSSTNITNATAIGADAIVSKSNSLVLGNLAYVGIGTPAPNNLLELKHLPTWGGYNLFSDSRSDNPNMNCNWDNAAFIVNGDYTKAILAGSSNSECGGNAPWTETFHVYGNGFVEAAAYGTMSDKRYKKNIKALENGLDIISNLKGVSYDFNMRLVKDKTLEGKPTYGFIAQEVERVIPHAVHKNKEGFYSVNYDAVIPFLTEAIKEQQKQIASKDKVIQELQNSLKDLANTVSQIKNDIATICDKGCSGLNDEVSKTPKQTSRIPAYLKTAWLGQNAPNPHSGNTSITYFIPEGASSAELRIVNLQGKVISKHTLDPKSEQLQVQNENLANGTYLYSLIVDNILIDSKKMEKE